MTTFEDAMAGELALLLRAGAPARAVRITVREQVVARLERGPLGAREVGDVVQAAVRAACRVARERQAPDELVDTVWQAALQAVRGHGGQSAVWLEEATLVVATVLDDWSADRGPHGDVARRRAVTRGPTDW